MFLPASNRDQARPTLQTRGPQCTVWRESILVNVKRLDPVEFVEKLQYSFCGTGAETQTAPPSSRGEAVLHDVATNTGTARPQETVIRYMFVLQMVTLRQVYARHHVDQMHNMQRPLVGGTPTQPNPSPPAKNRPEDGNFSLPLMVKSRHSARD